ncbi:MAG: hypothetical protein KAT77_03680 [Nanoarchaeota archaeon]|nr:hypothetical protein [Nanoarchaeota archaeon]
MVKWLVLLLAVVFLAGCMNLPLPDDLVLCEPGDECVVVPARGCCGCSIVINAKYEELWYHRTFEECPGRMCKLCPPTPIGGKCEKGFCVSGINDFESCVNAGYPAMESYPRQCRAGDVTYTEVIE